MNGDVGLETLGDACFKGFLELAYQLTGITIPANRKAMVQGRVRKRVRALGLEAYEDYLELVKADPGERLFFVDAITTNETYFFRTRRIWDWIEKSLLPEWSKSRPGRTLRALSAAASSGEEAHSLAILCCEHRKVDPLFQFEILGVDVSQKMIELCERGAYSGRSIESFAETRPKLFADYMRKRGDAYEARADARARLKFRRHNLFEPLRTPEKFDLILLRNVLIYFAAPDQEMVLRNLSASHADRGALVIGESESLAHVQTDYAPVEPFIYAKKAGA